MKLKVNMLQKPAKYSLKTASGQSIPLVDIIMNSRNVPKAILKSFIDLLNMAKGLMDENQQPSVQQELEVLFPSTRGGGRGGESRELHRVGAGESSTTTDTNTTIETLSYHKIVDCRNMMVKNL